MVRKAKFYFITILEEHYFIILLLLLLLLFSRNVTANDARLIFKGNKIVSGSMLSSFAMKDLPDKSTGTLLLDASDHSTTKYFPSISTANKLSWDIQKEPSATLASSLSVTSETRQTSSIASDRSQAKPLWVFSSELEYIAGAFIMGVSEGVSNSLAEVEGTYSYAGLRNWYVFVITYLVLYTSIS